MIIKVCGMRDADNIRSVEAEVKPTLMGFICWQGSPRFIGTSVGYLPECGRVGVFVNQELGAIKEYAKGLDLTHIQLHGTESAEFCSKVREETGLKVIKAVQTASAEDIKKGKEYAKIADLLLFDTKCASVGGSGRKFDWNVLGGYTEETPFLLSGGIGPDDADEILQLSHPSFAGIDLNSRFESGIAIKDIEKLSKFVNKLR